MLIEIDKITSKISWTGYDLGHQSIEDNWSRIKQVMKEQSDWSWEEPQAIYVPKQFNNRKLFDVPVHLWYNLNSTNDFFITYALNIDRSTKLPINYDKVWHIYNR